MRRIYESRALEYDEDDPHAPTRPRSSDDRSSRTIDWAAASHALVPTRLRPLALSVSVETDREVYAPGEPVRFRVSIRNRVPFPVAVRTESPVPWRWHVDGLLEASHVAAHPTEPGLFEFGRSERKTFTRRWSGRIRESARSWRPADPGEHTLDVRLAVPDADRKGLTAETTVEIE